MEIYSNDTLVFDNGDNVFTSAIPDEITSFEIFGQYMVFIRVVNGSYSNGYLEAVLVDSGNPRREVVQPLKESSFSDVHTFECKDGKTFLVKWNDKVVATITPPTQALPLLEYMADMDEL
jgi:hypothetical protein